MDGSWTIAELAELAATTLAAGDQQGHGQARVNGRVRDVPNERLIRWYVTVGLVDPPLSRRGRVARYGPRHLLQLVAIKRRQAEGRSLAEIQAELAGATDDSLAAVARVPEAALATGADAGVTVAGHAAPAGSAAPAGRVPPPGRAARAGRAAPADAAALAVTPTGAAGPAARPSRARRRPATGTAMTAGAAGAPARFWAQRPEASAAAPPRPGSGGEGGMETARPDAGLGAAAGSRDWPRLACAIRLAPGVTLLLDGAAPEPGAGDLAAIAAAADPLLRALASTGLRPAAQPASRPTAQPASRTAAPSASCPAAAPDSAPDDPESPQRSQL
jgi:DNA-binding transcriptional MerR regulator